MLFVGCTDTSTDAPPIPFRSRLKLDDVDASCDEFSDSVSTYAFDVGTGQLTLLDTVTTLPGGFDGGNNTCADVHITPDRLA